MQRLNDDRGVVAVMMALLMVPLIGFAAISIDVAATFAERQQLQTGADAAALAIAQDCARSSSLPQCGSPPQTTAEHFAVLNSNDGEAVASLAAVPIPSTGRVTVANEGVREHWFAPVLGINTTDIRTTSKAGWGAVSGGTAALPLAFNLCEFMAQSGGKPSNTKVTLHFTKTSTTSCPKPQSGNLVPGGFGWLDTDGATCRATSKVGQDAVGDPGVSPSTGCKPSDFVSLQNAVVMLPIFDEFAGGGNSAWYRIHGYVAFKITGYRFTGDYQWGTSCSGSERCIEGYFTRSVDQTGDFDYSPTAPYMGASVVELLP